MKTKPTSAEVEKVAKRMRNHWHKQNLGSLENTLYRGQWLRLARWHLAQVAKASAGKSKKGGKV